MHYKHHKGSYRQEQHVHGDGVPMVSTLIGQGTRCAEYLDDGNKAEKQEYNPDYSIAFK